MDFAHTSVLLEESIKSLNIQGQLVYVDGTTGGAGHSIKIAEKLTNGKLYCFDKDPDAISVSEKRLGKYDNVKIINSDFLYIKEELLNIGVNNVDGILLDLGVSSHQLDTSQRGFSYHQDGDLDMRMSQHGFSASYVVNRYDEKKLAEIFFSYGEEKFSRQIAKAIVEKRAQQEIKTTFELVDIIKESVPSSYKRKGNPAKKTFQALRIEVNGELKNLRESIEKGVEILNSGGRFVIITFHSLEDRVVKQTFNSFIDVCKCPPDFPVCVCNKKPMGKLISKKPIIPTSEEIESNRRSRSSKLRIFEKM